MLLRRHRRYTGRHAAVAVPRRREPSQARLPTVRRWARLVWPTVVLVAVGSLIGAQPVSAAASSGGIALTGWSATVDSNRGVTLTVNTSGGGGLDWRLNGLASIGGFTCRSAATGVSLLIWTPDFGAENASAPATYQVGPYTPAGPTMTCQAEALTLHGVDGSIQRFQTAADFRDAGLPLSFTVPGNEPDKPSTTPVQLQAWSGTGSSDNTSSRLTFTLKVLGALLVPASSPTDSSIANFACNDPVTGANGGTGGTRFGSESLLQSDLQGFTTYQISFSTTGAPFAGNCRLVSVTLIAKDGSRSDYQTEASLAGLGLEFSGPGILPDPPPTPTPIPTPPNGQPLQVTPSTVTPGGQLLVRPQGPCPAGTARVTLQLLRAAGGSWQAVASSTTKTTAIGTWASAKLAVPTNAFGQGFYVSGTCSKTTNTAGKYVSSMLSGVAPPDGTTYVALGDSYSSGEGNAPFDAGTDLTASNVCHRSTAAWPRLLGVSIGDHLACSGAVIQDLYRGQEAGGPDTVGQISRLRSIDQYLRTQGQHVTTVTLTISGNDIGFSTIVRTCLLAQCLAHPERVTAKVNQQRSRVTKALKDIHAAAPDAHIDLVGYPRLFPSQSTSLVNCSWLSSREQERANTLAVELDGMLRTAAQDTGIGSVSYTSVLDALDGHELCSSDSWVFPIDPGPLAYGFDTRQGHPTLLGQQAIAAIVGQTVKP